MILQNFLQNKQCDVKFDILQELLSSHPFLMPRKFEKQDFQWYRSEVESRTQGSRPRTQKNFEAKAKDRPSRGQGQGPRTQAQVSSKKEGFQRNFSSDLKKGIEIFFSGKKGLQNFFFRRFPLEENKKRSLQIFCEVSGAFQQNFNGSNNSAVLEPRTGQFLRT